MGVLLGGVSQLYQGDLDLGRRAVELLLDQPPTVPDLYVEDLYYGAVAVAQRLGEIDPSMLVLIGAEARGRVPGTIERRRIAGLDLAPDEVQVAVDNAVTGYVGIDLVIEVAWGLGMLPARTVAFEVEPATTGPDPHLSPLGARALTDVVALARAEVERAPLLQLGDELCAWARGHPLEDSRAARATGEVLDGLEVLDREGRWGTTFAARDRLRAAIAAGEVSEGMTGTDWALWWSLVEELDRLQAADAQHGAPPTVDG